MKWYEVSDEEFVARSREYATKKDYAQSYGMKSTSVKFRARLKELGITYDKLNRFSKEDLTEAVENSDSISGVIRYLSGGQYVRSYYNHVLREAHEYGIELPRYGKGGYVPNSYISDDEFFVSGTRRAGSSIRSRLMNLGVPYQCSEEGCPLSSVPEIVINNGIPRVMWLNKEVTLQVDHVDGNNTNNLRTNLRFLCPNCHAATDTYVGRNSDRSTVHTTKHKPSEMVCSGCGGYKYKSSAMCQGCRFHHNRTKSNTKYPDVAEIVRGVEKEGLLQYSKGLGVSDNALRKYLRRCGVTVIPKKARISVLP